MSCYSNFNCLLQLPFRVIKLDMNLIRMDLTPDGHQRFGLIKTLNDFLHEQKMKVIAEGVETPAVAEELIEMGVDHIQGYVYARLMPETELLDFFRR